GVGSARVRLPARASDRRPVPANVMFGKALVPELRPEQLTLARFDLYLYDVMKSERLEGQIVFEYGTLLRSIGSWAGLRVLDVGTGRSTLPAWMCHAGARVTAFDLSTPAAPPAIGGGRRTTTTRGRRCRARGPCRMSSLCSTTTFAIAAVRSWVAIGSRPATSIAPIAGAGAVRTSARSPCSRGKSDETDGR